jgi:hypothetical protein
VAGRTRGVVEQWGWWVVEQHEEHQQCRWWEGAVQVMDQGVARVAEHTTRCVDVPPVVCHIARRYVRGAASPLVPAQLLVLSMLLHHSLCSATRTILPEKEVLEV